jgi:hypothetical protein
MERRAAGVGLRIDDRVRDRAASAPLERGRPRPLVGDALDPADAGGHVQRRDAETWSICGSAPRDSRSFISSTSPDCDARRNAVAPFSSSHWFVKTVRVSVLSLTRAFTSRPCRAAA